MCRLFTEENDLPHTTETNPYQSTNERGSPRVKRYAESVNLHGKDIQKVEALVDELYDDVEENGQKVTYRRRNISSTKPIPDGKVRRFDFAPATLLPGGPDEESFSKEADATEKYVPGQSEDPGTIPWIKRWKYGIVPYFISPKTYDTYLAESIIHAFDYIEKTTCIRLQRLREKPLDHKSLQDADWLYITNPAGIRQCVHSNEREPNAGVQTVVIGYNCMSLGEIAHEVMHVLGFSHEHTRLDRDQHISVDWSNIKPGYKKYFELQTENRLPFLPYDYESVLHYPPRAFSKNGKRTITAPAGKKIGQREGLSEIDIEKISTIYGLECNKRNKDYLMKTCPSVVAHRGPHSNEESKAASPEEIKNYFKDRLWPFGVVNYKFKDNVEFSTEEIENIKTVLNHIEKETCIEFRDITDIEADEYIDDVPIPLEDNELIKTNLLFNTTNDDEPGHQQRVVLELDIDEKQEKTNASDKHYELNIDLKDEPVNIEENEILDYDGGEPRVRERRHQANSKATPKPVENVEQKRRHAGSVLVLRRSPNLGCRCPRPGRPTGNKHLQISSDCFNSVNDLLHFFVHVLGLDHQHNMHDRDSYIHIVWDQLTPDLAAEMEKKYPPAASAGFAYDYQSVMHFPWLQIKDGVTSVMYPIWNDGWAMGHWQGLSTTDVKKLNRIYEKECLARSREDKASTKKM